MTPTTTVGPNGEMITMIGPGSGAGSIHDDDGPLHHPSHAHHQQQQQQQAQHHLRTNYLSIGGGGHLPPCGVQVDCGVQRTMNGSPNNMGPDGHICPGGGPMHGVGGDYSPASSPINSSSLANCYNTQVPLSVTSHHQHPHLLQAPQPSSMMHHYTGNDGLIHIN